MGVTTLEGRFIFLFRSALFVGLGSVVATIIYLTPIPDKFPQSCRRRCHELDWPMICRVKMVVEEIPCLMGEGDKCPLGTLTVNRQIPGPLIQVCENDIVMVDVTNRVPGRSMAVHWRGQTLKETPHMDGVPMVTQCPILPYTTFQYKFRASEAGTHFWRFTPGIEGSGGLFGPLIVKQSDARETHRHLYDTDDSHHVIIIAANSNSVSINAAEQHSSPMNITSGVRHRFRVLFAGHPSRCSLRLRIDHTPLLVIALDGHTIKPDFFTSVQLAFGERLDFVVQVNENTETEPLQLHAEPVEDCSHLGKSSIPLQLLSSSVSPKKVLQKISENSKQLQTIVDEKCTDNTRTYLNNLEALQDIEPELTATILDHKIFFFFGVRPLRPGTNATIVVWEGEQWGAAHINNKTMILPSSPLMAQLEDVDPAIFCDAPCEEGQPCECVHVLDIPLGDSVEILLIHQGGGGNHHVFHFHGNSFYVVGARQLKKFLATEEVIALENEGILLEKNLTRPIRKDSVAIPEKGVVALRFKAYNPGYWLLDQELSHGGMQVLIHVGDPSDLPKTPKNYPRCGSWVGPEFFLA